MGQFDTFVAVQVTDEGERDLEFPECLLISDIEECILLCGVLIDQPLAVLHG